MLTGALVANQATLTLNGPGVDKLDIDAAIVNSRVINHQGTGTLYINGVALSSGTYSSSSAARGGCLYSKGSVALSHASVYSCTARTTAGVAVAQGGGIFTQQKLTLNASSVHDNSADASSGGSAAGGGAYTAATVGNQFLAQDSTIAHNHVTAANTVNSNGGGLRLRTGGVISNSTISGNTSNGDAGGISVNTGGPTPPSFSLLSSTVSGNSAAHFASGVLANNVATVVTNSTIAFNTTSNTSTIPPSAGLVINQFSGNPLPLTLQSNIIANNTTASTSSPENDFGFVSYLGPFSNSSTNNLIGGVYSGVPLPAGTISGVCPRLGPLRFNGGPTSTHALLSGSRGIDEGANGLNFADDQRGPGYPRISGSVADIGAYEVQQADMVFDNGFDGCPALPP
ncbi:hypothetical protein GCM10009105_30410 [Dokdonella soli]|uniref:Right handed beta helix domain-containing protein n=1 Tax=Dokdonella soli TaxID=529810 RepID=A0ABN1ITN5_9GAMM